METGDPLWLITTRNLVAEWYDLLPLLASDASTQDLVEQVLISNQVTHPSSFSAVACVGQALLMAKCINWRLNAEKDPNQKLPKNFFMDTYHEVAEALQHCTQKFKLLHSSDQPHG